jgi:hypothetical protein
VPPLEKCNSTGQKDIKAVNTPCHAISVQPAGFSQLKMQTTGLGSGFGQPRPAQPCPTSSQRHTVPQLTTIPYAADRASQAAELHQQPVARRRRGTQQVEVLRMIGRGNVLTMATQGASASTSTGEDQRPLVPLAELEDLCRRALGTVGYTPEEAATLFDVSLSSYSV